MNTVHSCSAAFICIPISSMTLGLKHTFPHSQASFQSFGQARCPHRKKKLLYQNKQFSLGNDSQPRATCYALSLALRAKLLAAIGHFYGPHHLTQKRSESFQPTKNRSASFPCSPHGPPAASQRRATHTASRTHDALVARIADNSNCFSCGGVRLLHTHGARRIGRPE